MKHGKTLKRIGALLMAFLLLSAFGVAAETQDASLTIPNGDFQKDAEGWEMSKLKDSCKIMTEGDNQYLHLFANTDEDVNVFSSKVDATAGETFVWTFDVRSAKTTRVYVRFLDEDGDVLSGKAASVEQYIPASSDRWTTYKAIGTAPENTSYVQLQLSVYEKEEEADFDNIRVEKLEVPSADIVENGAMEIVANGLPTGFTISGEGCTVTETEGRSNSRGLKISTSEETAEVTVSTTTWLVLKDGVKYDISAYMNLKELTAGDGVRLELYKRTDKETLHKYTDYFIETAYADGTDMEWRKMMIPLGSLEEPGLYILRVTFKGQGTVYLDDFAAVPTNDIVRNGDFEGFAADYKPAGWTSNLIWGEDGNLAVLREGSTDNHYLRFIKNTPSTLQSVTQDIGLKPGVRYKAEADIKGKSWDCIMNLRDVFDYKRAGTTADGGLGWTRDFSVYATCPEGLTRTSQFIIGDRDGSGSATTGIYASFDNVSCTVADEPDTLTISETEEKVTAVFTGMGTDYNNEENNRKVSVILARYLVTGTIFDVLKTELVDFTIVTGSAAKVKYIDQDVCSITKFGELPMEISASMEKPASGTYKYKAFAVDASNRLLPFVHAESL